LLGVAEVIRCCTESCAGLGGRDCEFRHRFYGFLRQGHQLLQTSQTEQLQEKRRPHFLKDRLMATWNLWISLCSTSPPWLTSPLKMKKDQHQEKSVLVVHDCA